MSVIAAHQIEPLLVKRLFKNLQARTSLVNPSRQVDVLAGTEIVMDDGSYLVTLASDVTADITVSGAGGLDSGIEATDTWYYIYVIYDSTNGNVAALLSASGTTPTLPGTYDKKRLVGVVRNNSSSDFYAFVQRDEYVGVQRQIIVTGFGLTTWTSFTLAPFAPLNLAKTVLLVVQARDTGSASISLLGTAPWANGAVLFDSIGLRCQSGYFTTSGSTDANSTTGSHEMLIPADGLIYLIADAGDIGRVWAAGYKLQL